VIVYHAPVRIIRSDRFIFHRFLTDAIGHLIGSYVSIAATHLVDPKDTWEFPAGYALALAATFMVSDFAIGRLIGNRKWFGLLALLVASIVGYGLVGLIGISPLFLIPALLFPLVIRLMAWPIVAYFRPER
jgi:hypothetical protein